MVVWLRRVIFADQSVLNESRFLMILGRMALQEIHACLVLLGVHLAAFDQAQANVDNVAVVHCKTNASRKHGTGEEVQYEDVGRRPCVGNLPCGLWRLSCHNG
jgi:hypothetical protein